MEKLYKYKGLLWEPANDFTNEFYFEGPYCSTEDCTYEPKISVENDHFVAFCIQCKKKIKLDNHIDIIREEARKKFLSTLRSKKEVVSLDLPPTNVGTKTHDDNYWISSRIGQKNGKKFAVIYLGEQTKKQSEKEKVQFFIDLEDEELRHDPNNMPPGDLLASVKVEFSNSTTKIDYKK